MLFSLFTRVQGFIISNLSLTNYEMARCPVFVEMAKDALVRGTCEVGMHLHAWNTPPYKPLTGDDMKHQPYLIEFPDIVMEEKIKVMTSLLEDTFSQPMVSHRAGRWALDERYILLLEKYGYKADCSVTPGISWREAKGAPNGHGGTDYQNFPSYAYCPTDKDISKPGGIGIIELPVTIVRNPAYEALPLKIIAQTPLASLARKVIQRICSPEYLWVRPTGGNLPDMMQAVQIALGEGADYVEFMLHSSELMPGGSPRFPDKASIESLYEDIEGLFHGIRKNFEGRTIKEYVNKLQNIHPHD